MLSYSSLTNSKLQIIKTSIIIVISHLIRCNYGEFACGNIYFLKNLLSLLFGFIFFNFHESQQKQHAVYKLRKL